MNKSLYLCACLILLTLTSGLYAQEIDPQTGYEYSWEELRAMEEFDYSSRWDDLGLLIKSHWISAEEFSRELDLSPVLLKEDPSTGDITFLLQGEDEHYPLISFTRVVVGVEATIREQEEEILATIRSNGDRFYEAIPTGVADIRAYWRKDRGWIYLFPENGISYIFINYQKSNRETVAYLKDKDSPDPQADLGKAFARLLISKYDKLL